MGPANASIAGNTIRLKGTNSIGIDTNNTTIAGILGITHVLVVGNVIQGDDYSSGNILRGIITSSEAGVVGNFVNNATTPITTGSPRGWQDTAAPVDASTSSDLNWNDNTNP